MKGHAILSFGRQRVQELTANKVIAAGAGFVELESTFNALHNGAGAPIEGLTEIITRMTITDTMPAGSEIVITPYVTNFGDLPDITAVLGAVTDDTLVNRLENNLDLHDASHVKITYRLKQGVEYTVTSLSNQAKEKAGGPLATLVTSIGTILTAVFATVSNAFRTEEVDPISQHHFAETLAEVVDGTDGTYYYYVDMDAFRKGGTHCILNGGTGADIAVTVEGTLQDDGTAPASCTYKDVTSVVFGTGSLTVTGFLIDDAEYLAVFKYIRIVVVANSGANDADWILYHKRLY